MDRFSYLNIKMIPDGDASGGGAGETPATAPVASDVTSGEEPPAEETSDDDDESESDDEKPKPKKPAKPKTVTVAKDELDRLRAADKKAKDAESARKRATDETVRTKEDEAAAKDGLKAVEMVRKRLSREVQTANDRIAELENENTTLRSQLVGRVMKEGIADASTRVLAKMNLTLRPGAMKHIARDLSDRFEATVIDESTGEYAITDKETGETADIILAEMFKSADYALFVEPKASGAATDVRGSNHRTVKTGKEAKTPSVVESYNNRVREMETANGVQPSIGLRPKS